MTVPYLDHDGLRLYLGDAVERLREMPDESVDLCFTSPPFWNLRDYGVDGQIGLEPTPDDWARSLVGVFAEVHRVLRSTGVLVVECGDGYANPGHQKGNPGDWGTIGRPSITKQEVHTYGKSAPGLKNKDLVGQPFVLALALRDFGWYWRGIYVWDKPNPMPESVSDRCTTSHSYVLHLAKSDRYFWDPDAIAEPVSENQSGGRQRAAGTERYADAGFKSDNERDSRATDRFQTAEVKATKNARSVWTILTEPSGLGLCPECLAYWPRNAPLEHCGVEVVQHYAAFPLTLAEKVIRAATSERGVCPCGAPWRRIVERGDPELAANTWSAAGAADQDVPASASSTLKHVRSSETVGWEPTCSCGLDPVPAVVLDPFSGSGTTLLAARRLRRHGVGVELNPHYCEMTARRLAIPDAVERAAETSAEPTQLVLG